MSVEFLLSVGDGLGTIIVGVLVALVRSWNSGYLRQYLNGRGQETEGIKCKKDRFDILSERIDSMEERIERINERVEDTDKRD